MSREKLPLLLDGFAVTLAVMGREDWYRNRDWSPEIEEAFFAKLARAHRKGQYLSIQAWSLVDSHPEVALDLIRRYFELEHTFDRASAYQCRAHVETRMNHLDAALVSYENALAHEAAHPYVLTQVYLDLPLLIVRKQMRDRYTRALEVLENARQRPRFPLEVFRWNALMAILLEAGNNREGARSAATAALTAVGASHSGFKSHPKLGLVGAKDDDLLEHMSRILAAARGTAS